MAPGIRTLDHVVAYPDTDAGGIVYHGRYFDMAERSRQDILAQAGLSYALLERDYATMLVIYRIGALYHASAMLEDRLTIRTVIADCGPARTTWVTTVSRSGEKLVTVRAEIVALDIGTRAVRTHPGILLDRLAPFHERASPGPVSARI